MCDTIHIMPTRSQRPLVNKLLGLEPLTVGSHKDLRLSNIDEALLAMGGDFSPEQLAAALDAQTHVEVTVSTLYRWRRELVG
jgi:hypothetical protein